jgi:hypothetical protein
MGQPERLHERHGAHHRKNIEIVIHERPVDSSKPSGQKDEGRDRDGNSEETRLL